jgi:hypothetical protein
MTGKDHAPLKTESVVAQSDIRQELQQELQRAPVEPLLPIEKKLIGWSLTIGIVLLVALALINHYAPVTF